MGIILTCNGNTVGERRELPLAVRPVQSPNPTSAARRRQRGSQSPGHARTTTQRLVLERYSRMLLQAHAKDLAFYQKPRSLANSG